MALPLPPGLTHAEVAFLCEMELVTVVPRQRLESIKLLSGTTTPLRPPHRADLPLWLALLLKKQRRANIVPPPWLHPASLRDLIHRETKIDPEKFSAPPPPPARADRSRPGQSRGLYSSAVADSTAFSPPFLHSCTAAAPSGYLPYHWLEMAETLLSHAADDMPAPAGEIRGLVRDLVEVRAAKMRAGIGQAGILGGEDGGFLDLTGVGAVELAENRGFVLGVVDGVRKIGASAEASRREEEEMGGAEEEDDEDMGI
ncbi:GINS complex, PSF2 component [Coniochaeta ligniaria NRRL 30616]|uniref:DNA replication complex GINS protein PSF2 n=1 Tax=Coniochaeta ligniaria NRRL 30616 TaxID=1408157 RepID=A0A1J7JHP5_9PEZI|nr:GINS complex, PSF2 component [Coniochaeta ligniaria NRRL 30616]